MSGASILTFFLDYGLDDVVYVVVNVFIDDYAFVNDGTLFRTVNLEFNEFRYLVRGIRKV